MKPTFYTILGVKETASPEEVQEAYRRLAKAYHPDRSGSDSVKRFREVQEAWETLGSPERRRAYDAELGRARRPQPEPRSAHRAGAATAVVADAGDDLHLELQMSVAEARAGGDVDLEVPAWVRCPHCGGRGGRAWLPCPACDGYGYGLRGERFTLHVPPGLDDGAVAEVLLREPGLIYRRLLIHVRLTD
jgi:molecular chaperone DnaJ